MKRLSQAEIEAALKEPGWKPGETSEGKEGPDDSGRAEAGNLEGGSSGQSSQLSRPQKENASTV